MKIMNVIVASIKKPFQKRADATNSPTAPHATKNNAGFDGVYTRDECGDSLPPKQWRVQAGLSGTRPYVQTATPREPDSALDW